MNRKLLVTYVNTYNALNENFISLLPYRSKIQDQDSATVAHSITGTEVIHILLSFVLCAWFKKVTSRMASLAYSIVYHGRRTMTTISRSHMKGIHGGYNGLYNHYWYICRTGGKNTFLDSSSLARLSSSVTKVDPTKKRRFWNWKTIAKLIKMTRIPFLVLSVYFMGHQQGMIDYAHDPDQQKALLLQLSINSVTPPMKKTKKKEKNTTTDKSEHTTTTTQTYSIRQGQISSFQSSCSETQRLKEVATVASDIINVAKIFVDAQVKKIDDKDQTEEGTKSTDEPLYLVPHGAEMKRARRRMSGEWTFYLIDTPIPNAFVSENLPQHIFVTTSMLSKYIENKDELALILGHEISHLILGHNSSRLRFNVVLRTLEVLILSMDPTEGFLSLLIISGLDIIRKAFSASLSRENEREADALGAKLAAMACYDTTRGTNVFHKMASLPPSSVNNNVAVRSDSSTTTTIPESTGFLDSHPSSMERHQTLLALATTKENPSNYTSCQKTKGFFHQLFMKSSNNQAK